MVEYNLAYSDVVLAYGDEEGVLDALYVGAGEQVLDDGRVLLHDGQLQRAATQVVQAVDVDVVVIDGLLDGLQVAGLRGPQVVGLSL